MKRSVNYFLMIQFLLYSLLFSKGKDCDAKDIFIESVNQNRQYILNKVNDSLISHKEIILKFYGFFKAEIPISISTKKYDILSSIGYIGRSISTINNLKYVNLNKQQGFQSIFIEDERFFRICIHAFKDKNYSVKNKAREILIKYGREDYLARYSDEIKEYIPRLYEAEIEDRILKLRGFLKRSSSKEDRKSINKDIKKGEKLLKNNYKEIEKRAIYDKLYLLLPMSQKEKKYLLDTIKIGALEYRARLGDKKAEKKLIDKFEEENNFRKKSALAKKLGIAGTKECAKALIRALYSPISDKERFKSPYVSGGYTTIRVPIISALLRINPEAEFKYDFCFVTERPTDDNRVELYGGRKKVQELFNNIVSWAEKTYNIKPIGTPPDTSEFILRKPGTVKCFSPISE